MGFRGFSHGFPQMFKDVWQNIDLLRLVIMILYTIFYYILYFYIYTYDDILYNLVNTQPMCSTMRPLSSASAAETSGVTAPMLGGKVTETDGKDRGKYTETSSNHPEYTEYTFQSFSGCYSMFGCIYFASDIFACN